ncbi:hypothetical protein [Pseudomonas tolaasii]|uniref:hypothetical protein n=1 Tax=Pseudomonas tolaasii TaxID=29442 RepID=UPI001C531F20|nr:hypothetical protein [Pseudomonas tolaasii]QXQ21743.1 hypothetical protein I7845_17165 [Pseudomonas tolaasii]
MEPRYKVKRQISMEIGGAKDGLRTSTSSPPGFYIYDTVKKKDLPEFYSSRAEAEKQCDQLNKDE